MERIENEMAIVEEEYDEFPLSDIEIQSRKIMLKKCNDGSEEYHILTCPFININMESLHPIMEPSNNITTNGFHKEFYKPINLCQLCGGEVKKVIHELRALYTNEINRHRTYVSDEFSSEIQREEARKLYPNWVALPNYESFKYSLRMIHVYETYLKMFSFTEYDL